MNRPDDHYIRPISYFYPPNESAHTAMSILNNQNEKYAQKG